MMTRATYRRTVRLFVLSGIGACDLSPHFDVGCSVLDVRCSALQGGRRTSNIQHPTSNTEHRTLNIERSLLLKEKPRDARWKARSRPGYASPPVRALKLQYILSYAVIGSVVPYLAVFFKQRGLDEVRIGYVVAAAAVAMMFTPALVALLADTCVDARRLSAGLLAVTAAALLAVREVQAFPAILALWTLHSATMWPVYPLQDAICFADQRRRQAAGEPVGSFASVRIWGSIGFIVPSAALFWLLRRDASVRVTFVVGAAFALAAAANALRLPAPGKRERESAGEMPAAKRGSPSR